MSSSEYLSIVIMSHETFNKISQIINNILMGFWGFGVLGFWGGGGPLGGRFRGSRGSVFFTMLILTFFHFLSD